MTCKKCKLPMVEHKGHVFHKQRKWRCPRCGQARMQQTRQKPAKG